MYFIFLVNEPNKKIPKDNSRKLKMLIPIRCFTCNKPIANLYTEYTNLLKNGSSEKDALDKIGLTRFCCRRMVLTHVEIIDKLILFEKAN